MTQKTNSSTLHAMVDIETMGTSPNAAVLNIGACIFDPFGSDSETTFLDEHKFQTTISFKDNEKQYRTFDADTIAWWLRQSKEAQDGLQAGHITNLKQAFTAYNLFIQSQNSRVTRIWAKSPDFDVVIMRDVYKSLGMMDTFKFWETRCVRTLTEAAYPNGDQPTIGVGIAHNALDDAIRQTLMVQHCNNIIAGNIQPRNQ